MNYFHIEVHVSPGEDALDEATDYCESVLDKLPVEYMYSYLFCDGSLFYFVQDPKSLFTPDVLGSFFTTFHVTVDQVADDYPTTWQRDPTTSSPDPVQDPEGWQAWYLASLVTVSEAFEKRNLAIAHRMETA